jgi:hypothetical protein
MQANQYDVYAQFLLECRKVMGTLDLEKLAYDEAYKSEFFSRVSLNADDGLFQIADLINREIDIQ